MLRGYSTENSQPPFWFFTHASRLEIMFPGELVLQSANEGILGSQFQTALSCSYPLNGFFHFL